MSVFGNSGRNPLSGPGFWNVDLGLFRTIDIGRVKVQFRAEALNALNHPNFSNPGGDISNAGTFGFITSTTGTGERNLRFGARVSFSRSSDASSAGRACLPPRARPVS